MIACIDIGGTSLKVAVANEKAELFDQDILPVKDNFDDFMNVIIHWIEEKKETYNIEGVAFSAPGAVDTNTGIIGGASAIPYIHGPNFKEIIKDRLGLPCSIGVAPNKFLAKMASDMRKPMGITILRKQEIQKKLWHY